MTAVIKIPKELAVELDRLAKLGVTFRFEPLADGFHRPERTFESWYTTPYLYGERDVQMARDKGQAEALALARKHYFERNRITRWVAKLCIGKPGLERSIFGLLKPGISVTDKIGLRSLSMALCSLTFNLRYLQGMAKEMGGSRRMWATIREVKAS